MTGDNECVLTIWDVSSSIRSSQEQLPYGNGMRIPSEKMSITTEPHIR